MNIPRFALPALLAALCCMPAPSRAAEPADETARLVAELGLVESKTALADRPGWRAPRKIVVMDADAARIAWLQPAAPGVQLVGAADAAATLREVADADALIGRCSAAVVEAGKSLRWIQHQYAGMERCVGIPGFSARGITLSNMQKIAGPVMSEHVLAFVLALSRGFATYVPRQASGEWAPEAVPESRLWTLEGKTLFVAGLGGIGTEVARRAHALGMNVIATRNTPHAKPDFVSEQGLAVDLPAFAARADVIVNTLPLTPETKGIFNRAVFDRAKRGALFVNVGRGGTVVTADLVAALQDGRLGGAGLDVTDPEPLPADHPLWHAPNVLITPHVSAGIDTGDEPRWLVARENLRRYASGGKLLSEVGIERGY